MTLESRTQALLDIVEADRRRRCDALLEEARVRAAAIVADAHAEARSKLRNAFGEERQRLEARLATAQARLLTHRRERARQRAGALLAEGSQRLSAALHARWRDTGSRDRWAATVIGAARQALPRGTWQIVHAPGWPDDQRDALAATLAPELGGRPHFVVAESACAGLKVTAAGNVIDGTLEGLTADRVEIGSRLLAALEDEA
jgi:vacuolar-type H+-ATPase subunit H